MNPPTYPKYRIEKRYSSEHPTIRFNQKPDICEIIIDSMIRIKYDEEWYRIRVMDSFRASLRDNHREMTTNEYIDMLTFKLLSSFIENCYTVMHRSTRPHPQWYDKLQISESERLNIKDLIRTNELWDLV